jgi:hypothetical protein
MKITDIKTFVVDNLWKNCFFEGLYGCRDYWVG